MRARVLTLRFSPALGGFDDSALQELMREQPVLGCREHVVHVEGLPYVVCIVTWLEAAANQCVDAQRCEPARREPTTTRTAPGNHQPAEPDPAGGLQGPRRQIFDAMRRWRSATAQREGVPPYVILTNRQLVEIVQKLPRSVGSLGEIHGLGDKKLERHGQAILVALVEAVRTAKESAPDDGSPAADVPPHGDPGDTAAAPVEVATA